MISTAALLVSLALAGAGPEPRAAPAPASAANKELAKRILDRALADRTAYVRLAGLTDRIGHRLSGTPALDRAITWAVEGFKSDGQDRVRAEPVMVPRWVRGAESAEIVSPISRRLHLLGLGGSVGTPKGGLTKEVVAVPSFEALEALGSKVKGKIVLFDHPMVGTGYGDAVPYRTQGAARAAKHGAAAVLIRSITAKSLSTPHTGATRYEEGGAKIPAAALSIEDATLLSRLVASGEKVTVKLAMEAKTLADVPSANVVADLLGRERPEEIVLIGAHLDSWDVGQGAHDDGAGCVMVMEALRILRQIGPPPRRTIRAVLFTNEENGLKGAFEYAKAHASELHAAAIEADSGAFAPLGFHADAHPDMMTRLQDLARLLEPLGASTIEASDHTGADLIPLAPTGATLLGLKVEPSTYFDYHHSEADTLDKIDPADLQKDVAALAIMAWALADDPEPLPRALREEKKK
jgi:carboxypeptidase Q